MAVLSLFATAGLLAVSGYGQTTATTTTTTTTKDDGTVKLEKYEVTGTRLSGATTEGALSISTYKMDDINLDGFGGVAEMLRKKMPQFGGGIGTVNEGFGNGGSGEATVSLRDLPLSRTLFLVNGRRTNMDVNLIPKAAVERVEILNDGASAVYGTDAVAGVVNFILKKDYEGAEVSARYSNTFKTDISERQFSLVAGGKVKNTNWTAAFETSKANNQYSIDRAVSVPAGTNVSGTSNPGLFTPVATAADRAAANALIKGDPGYVSATAPSSVNVLVPLRWYVVPKAGGTGLTAASQIPAAFIPADFLTLPATTSSTARLTLRNAEETRLNGILGSSSPVAYGGTNAGNAVLMPGLSPGFPFGYYTFAVRPYNRIGVTLTTDTKLTDKLNFFADVVVSRNQSVNQLAPSPLSGRTVTSTNYWEKTVLPATAAAGRDFTFGYRPVELGPRDTFNEFREAQFTAGFKGEITKGWNYEVAVMDDLWSFTSVQSGGVLRSVYDASLADPTSNAFNPYGYTPIFATASPVNPASLINSFSGSGVDLEHQQLTQIDGNVSGELMDLPAGKLRFVVGAEKRKVTDVYQPDSALQNGTIFPFNIESAYSHARTVSSVYAETEIPVLAELSIPIAARYEKFSDVGGSGVKPRVAFRWEPLAKELTIRGSWARGFVAPSLSQLDANAPTQNFLELLNPLTGIRAQPTNGDIENGNPLLKPEKSDSYLIGGVYSPKAVKGLSLGINYYRIKETNIPFTSAQYIVNQWFAAGPTNASNPFGATAKPSAANPLGAQVILNSDASLNQVTNVGPINSGTRLTDGFDLFGSYNYETEMGNFTLDASWTNVRKFTMANFPGDPSIDYLGKYWGSGSAMGNFGFPKWKGSTNLSWKKSAYSAGVAYNYVSGYDETEVENHVGAYATVDVRAGYRIPKVDVLVSLGVNNLMDRQPPRVISSFENQYDRAIADIRGRLWFVELSKKF